MKKNIRYIVLFFVILSSVSCITNRSTRLLQDRSSLPVYDSIFYPEYKLKANDELNVRIISLNPEIMSAFNLGSTGSQTASSLSYRIYDDGTVDIPFADSIKIVGLTLVEATNVIENRLKNVNDDIIVKLQLSNNFFYMVGASGKGKFSIYKDRLTIYQAIAMAGFTPGVGNLKKVKIIREQDNGTSDIVTFDLRTESIINSAYYYIQPNDVIYMETSKGNFFRIQSFSSLMGVISSSLTFLLLMLSYTK